MKRPTELPLKTHHQNKNTTVRKKKKGERKTFTTVEPRRQTHRVCVRFPYVREPILSASTWRTRWPPRTHACSVDPCTQRRQGWTQRSSDGAPPPQDQEPPWALPTALCKDLMLQDGAILGCGKGQPEPASSPTNCMSRHSPGKGPQGPWKAQLAHPLLKLLLNRHMLET